MAATIKVKCTSCDTRWFVRIGEIEPGDMPICPNCYSPGIAVEATPDVKDE